MALYTKQNTPDLSQVPCFLFESHVIPSRPIYYFFKRIFDFTLAILFLLVALPFGLLIAIVLWIDNPGPIFFRQQRVGTKRIAQGKGCTWVPRQYICYKFRTMITDADPSLHQEYVKALIHNDQSRMADLQGQSTQVRKLVCDPRITRVGRLLRKSSIDEFPQFINVLKGEMSIVGPRPAIPYEVAEYQPWHYRRLQAQPGITGLWQVTARSSADFDEMVRLDIEYVEKQSFWLDLWILFKTPWVVICCKGAI